MSRHIITLDFETLPILDRPAYPPEPVGLALQEDDGKPEYMAWGHPSGNNCTKAEVCEVLDKVLSSSYDLLFHNAKFDLAVLWEKLDFDLPDWRRVHDTTFLLFLADPHGKNFGLKEACEDLLGWAPEERDAVADYVWDHRASLIERYGGKITRAKGGPNSAGAWIGRCPAGVVKPYACGDVARTYALFQHLMPLVEREGMRRAYDRERRLLPIFLENERVGMRIDLEGLERDLSLYGEAMDVCESWLRKRLKSPSLNLDADQQLAEALSRSDVVDDRHWVLTPSGQRSVSKDNLKAAMFSDERVAQALGYRNRLKTCLKMFMEPWYLQGEQRNGVISTHWNQIRGGEGGTRTGRPSTTNPNFLNISKTFEDRKDGYAHPEFLEIPELPLVRKYILPDEGHEFLHRDFKGQELRVFAHFECGSLQRAYLRDPELSPHAWVKDKLEALMNIELNPTDVKILNFQAIYGGGAPAAAKKLDCSLAEAREYKAFHDQALPGRKVLNEEILRVVRAGDPIRTWGGRVYYPETPKLINGRMQSWEYKLINYLIQGSAADITKEVMCRWYDHPDRDARFLVQVYDEINISAALDVADKQMRLLKELMEGVELDVPMRSSAKRGLSWGSLEKCE